LEVRDEPSLTRGFLVLQLFALLFSNRWVGQWEKRWADPQALQACSQGKSARQKAKRPQKQKSDRSKPSSFYERVFTLRITLWYLLFQRLNFDTTLAAVVCDARKGGADRLGKRGQKLSKRIRSAHTSSYNEARQRLPLALLQESLSYVGQKIQALVGWNSMGCEKPVPLQRSRQLLDGSTLANPQRKQKPSSRTPFLHFQIRVTLGCHPAKARVAEGRWYRSERARPAFEGDADWPSSKQQTGLSALQVTVRSLNR